MNLLPTTLVERIGLSGPRLLSARPDTSHFEAPARRAPVIVTGTSQRNHPFFHGTTRDLTQEQRRLAYASMVFFLANFRAAKFAENMCRAAIERQVKPGEWEPATPNPTDPAYSPWAELFERPNPDMSQYEFFEWWSLNRDLTRGPYCLVTYATVAGLRVPRYLYPIYDEDGSVKPILNSAGGVESWVHRRADGRAVPYEADEVLWLGRRHPLHRGVGSSLIEAAAYQIDHAAAAAVYGRDAAREQGRPDVILVARDGEGALSAEEARDFGAQFAELYSTGSGANETPVVAGFDPVPVGISQKDAQFLETSDANEEALFTIFETPRAMFADEAYATGQQGAQRGFAVNTVQPNVNKLCDRLEFEFQRIFRSDPSALRVRPPNTVPVDNVQQAQIDEIHIRSGVRNRNEIRQREGLDTYDGGDDYLISSALMPAKMADEAGY